MTTHAPAPPLTDGAVGSAVWPAFDRAADRLRAELAGVPAEGDVVAAVCDAVRRSAGNVRAPDAALSALDGDATIVLERLRRHFGDELRATSADAAFGAVHVYSALAAVQSSIRMPEHTRSDGAAALDLTVEVAHDMRSPLAAILFMVDMLRTGRSGAVSPVQEQQLGMIYAAALGLNQLACDLIDYVRGGEDIIDRDPVPFSLAGVLYDVHDVIRPAAEEKGVDLRLVLPSDRPRVGSPAAIHRVLLNLASNAIRYSPRGTVTIVAEESVADRVRLGVEDSGGEIPPEVVSQMFQPFRTANSGVRAFSSSGLGLAICHRLVTALGSSLSVTTTPGRGAAFAFELELPFAGSCDADR